MFFKNTAFLFNSESFNTLNYLLHFLCICKCLKRALCQKLYIQVFLINHLKSMR